MTTENVALDDMDNVDEAPSRPVSAQLALLGDRAMAAPGDALERAVYVELPAAWYGAGEWVRDWEWWVNARTERGEVERRVARAQANGSGAMPVPFKEVAALRKARYLKSAIALAAVLLALSACSVAGFWSWHPWRWWGPALAIGLLAAGKYYGRAGRWVARLSWAPIPVFLTVGIEGWRWWPWLVAAALLALACEQRGLRMAKEMPDPIPSQRARDGVSFPKLWKTIEEHLFFDHQVTAKTQGGRPIVAEGLEIGVVYPVVADKALTKAHLDAIELLVGSPVGGVRWFADRDRAGSGDLHVRWGDVLDRPPAPPAPNPRGSGSVHHAKRIARGQLGAPLLLNRLRKHIVVLGGTGSGKTSLGWRLLDDIEENADEKPWGIDLRRKNLIAPYIRSFEGRVAYTVADADKLLDRFQAEIDRRVGRIAEQLEDADEDEIPDENWIPTSDPGHEQLTLLVDELTSLTPHKKLREKLALILETGRQAACVVAELTPDLDSKKIVDSSIFDQPHVKIMMATSQYDVKELFGVGAAASGWGVAATWERPRDAGKLLISSDEHLHPEVYRADRLEVEDIVARRRWRRAEAERVAQERRDAAAAQDAADGVIDAEIVSDEDLATEAALRAAIEACGDREGLPVREVADALGEDTAALVRVAVSPQTTYLRSTGRPERCFKRSALVSALHE